MWMKWIQESSFQAWATRKPVKNPSLSANQKISAWSIREPRMARHASHSLPNSASKRTTEATALVMWPVTRRTTRRASRTFAWHLPWIRPSIIRWPSAERTRPCAKIRVSRHSSSTPTHSPPFQLTWSRGTTTVTWYLPTATSVWSTKPAQWPLSAKALAPTRW